MTPQVAVEASTTTPATETGPGIDGGDHRRRRGGWTPESRIAEWAPRDHRKPFAILSAPMVAKLPAKPSCLSRRCASAKELARKGARRAKSVVALAYAGAVRRGESVASQKISELYDRVGLLRLRQVQRVRQFAPRICPPTPAVTMNRRRHGSASQCLRADSRHHFHRTGQAPYEVELRWPRWRMARSP